MFAISDNKQKFKTFVFGKCSKNMNVWVYSWNKPQRWDTWYSRCACSSLFFDTRRVSWTSIQKYQFFLVQTFRACTFSRTVCTCYAENAGLFLIQTFISFMKHFPCTIAPSKKKTTHTHTTAAFAVIKRHSPLTDCLRLKNNIYFRRKWLFFFYLDQN